MSRRPSKLQRVDLPALTGRIRGTTGFGFHVVGESYFQVELRHIRNNMSVAYDNDLEAFIVTEPNNLHDENACAVYIDSFKVGYLPSDAARDYVTQMRGNGVFGESCFQIRAKLTGGFGERPKIGVMLNLPAGAD
ncbi:HIRAN domain-containing protein [Pseudomonas frederiksbergensis]|uniref:HIRAN domain-containing protein n=1 Tax=Pseudomonas frederiksbergensis TaxID=104087 RepID=UPI003D1A6D32